jgi:hypothetical protein
MIDLRSCAFSCAWCFIVTTDADATFYYVAGVVCTCQKLVDFGSQMTHLRVILSCSCRTAYLECEIVQTGCRSCRMVVL